jgi:hypothetical protein
MAVLRMAIEAKSNDTNTGHSGRYVSAAKASILGGISEVRHVMSIWKRFSQFLNS